MKLKLLSVVLLAGLISAVGCGKGDGKTTNTVTSESEFDQDGYNRRTGFNKKGFNRDGDHENGTKFDKWNCKADGLNEHGVKRATVKRLERATTAVEEIKNLLAHFFVRFAAAKGKINGDAMLHTAFYTTLDLQTKKNELWELSALAHGERKQIEKNAKTIIKEDAENYAIAAEGYLPQVVVGITALEADLTAFEALVP